jgi:hypothetical protein
LWLPIGILYGVECGCKYTFISLLLVWIDEQICWFCGPNWLPNSMPLNMFWTIKIPNSCFYGWSINVLATFYDSTCLTIPILIWKGIKGQSMITCPSSSQNAQTFESNMIISKSTYSWSRVSVVYFVWSNFQFLWCEYDCDISSNAFTYASTY